MWLPDRLRLQHCHVLGATGSGKSTLLGLMAWQDLTFGNGVAVIDPHGDLIDRLIPHIPPERWDDVVLFDPADEEFAVAFNPLAPGSGRERDLRATDFIAVMKRHTSGWGDQMSSLLGNAVLAFLHSERGGTLPELRRFLVDPAFRATFLKSVTHGEVLHYWEHEAALANRSAVGSIVTRLDELLRYESLLHLLGQRANRLDFADILDSGKIFLARLSKGQVGATNAFLLGSLLVARFHQTAIARQARNPAERPPYFLILDEAAELLTGTVAEILTGARKYGLGLTLAHQHLGQLRPEDGVRGAVLGSCATRVCFRVDGEDARKLADEFAGFGPTDLMNLPDRQAIARLGPRDTACNLETIFVPTPPRTYAEVYPEILARTRARYCTPRAEIRAQLAELRSQVPPRRDKVDPFAKLAVGKEEDEATPTAVVPTASEAVGVAEVTPEPPVALPAAAAATALAPEVLPHFALAAEREHRVTQNFLRQLAGGRGWQSRLEAVLGAAGQLDVLLERGGRRLGCEVAVTNQARFEVAGLARRLAAGLDFVLVVADDRGHREALARRAEQELAAPQFARVRFLGRDDVAAFLDELDQQDSRREEVVRDARVVHEQVALEPDARAESAAAVTAVIRRLGRRGGSPMSGTPAGLWLRVSTAQQAEGDSLEHHERRARAYAAAHGFDVVEVYRLEGVSGAVSLEHPLARKLRRDVRAGRIRVLLTAKMARLSRDGLASRLLLRLFEEAGARILFLDDGLDSGNPQTRFLLQQLADFAELERTESAGRIRASLKTRIALGKPLGGKAPYGYRRVEGRLEPDPATAPIRRLIFELYAEHRAFVTVARELERRGIPSPAGRRWSDMSVKWLLSDPVVIGQHRYNYLARGGPAGRQRYKPAAEMRLEPVPPIVPTPLWEEVQALWKEQRARRTPRGVRYPFSGLTFCPCGDKIYPRAEPRRFICYRCGVTVEADTVEEAFVRRLATLPVPEDSGEPAPDDPAGAVANLTLDLQALELQERELTGKLRRAVESLADPAVRAETVRPWEERLRALRAHLLASRERLEVLRREARESPPGPAAFRTLADVWATAPVAERKRLAQALVERVTVLSGRELKFAWKITPGPAGGT